MADGTDYAECHPKLSLAACLSHTHCGLVAGAGVEGEICE